MPNKLNILFVGDLNLYGRSHMRFQVMKELGHNCTGLSHTVVAQAMKIIKPRFAHRLFWKLRIPIDETGVHRAIRREIKDNKFDIIWIEKGNNIKPCLLKRIKKKAPGTVLVSCSEDDMYARHGHSLWYRLGLRYYDTVFTTKVYNLEELKQFGTKKTVLFLDSFYPELHKPYKLTPDENRKYQCDVSAIGAFEPARANSLLHLAKSGIKVSVWGNDWSSWQNMHPNLEIKNEFLYYESYCKAICASKINLNFLRKINRDEVTSRSVEIPACGGFMLAERTARHQDFFKEGVEAEYFSSDQELVEKVKYYLKDESKRRGIASAGRKRCLRSGYSMRDQIEKMLSVGVIC